jgi:biopolymer transport protein ExbD
MGISGIGGRAKGSMADPNIVPLIDILLVLIIIFMVITPLTPKGLDTLVPQPSPEQQQQTSVDIRTIVIQVECQDPDARVCQRISLKINQDSVSWDTLGPRLEDIFKTRAEKVAFVKGSDNIEFAEIARAIDIARTAGVDKIGLITAKVESGE